VITVPIPNIIFVRNNSFCAGKGILTLKVTGFLVTVYSVLPLKVNPAAEKLSSFTECHFQERTDKL